MLKTNDLIKKRLEIWECDKQSCVIFFDQNRKKNMLDPSAKYGLRPYFLLFLAHFVLECLKWQLLNSVLSPSKSSNFSSSMLYEPKKPKNIFKNLFFLFFFFCYATIISPCVFRLQNLVRNRTIVHAHSTRPGYASRTTHSKCH